VEQKWDCGATPDTVTATLNEETLTVSGAGAMKDYDKCMPPWNAYKRSIANVVIKDGVTTIGEGAFGPFYGLTSVVIPDSVTSIGRDAFWGCYSLTAVTLPRDLATIGDSAFFGCDNLTTVTIPNGVTTIGEGAFFWCSGLMSATIPDSVTFIGEAAFCRCIGLTSITIPNSVTSIGEGAFCDCANLTTINCLSAVPPKIDNMVDNANKSAVFDGVCVSTVCLCVPDGSIDAYKAAYGWKDFRRINSAI
jgi:hypothetical protein